MKDQKASEWRFPHFRNHAIYSLNILQKIKKWYCIITKKPTCQYTIRILYQYYILFLFMVLSCSRIDGVAGGYMICSAQMTIFIAARTARVPHGERRHASTAGSPAPSRGSAAQRLRPAWHFFRSPPQDAGFLPAGKGTRSSLRPLRRKSGKFSALLCSRAMKGVIDYKKKFL